MHVLRNPLNNLSLIIENTDHTRNPSINPGYNSGMYGCMAVWLYGCMVVWLYGCMVVWLYGCMAVWLYGCMVVWLYGYGYVMNESHGAGLDIRSPSIAITCDISVLFDRLYHPGLYSSRHRPVHV